MLFRIGVLNTLLLLPLLIAALTVHELCHGLMAYALGDKTAKRDGRLTLNPIRHIDPIGLLMILIAGFGWARPVMVNPFNLKNPKVDMALIAAAGPISNFIMGFIGSMIFVVLLFSGVSGMALTVMASFSSVNIVLGVFNLLPVPPLDGSKIVLGALPNRVVERLPNVGQYSMFILLILILPIFGGSSIIGFVIFPLVDGIFNLFITFAGYIFVWLL